MEPPCPRMVLPVHGWAATTNGSQHVSVLRIVSAVDSCDFVKDDKELGMTRCKLRETLLQG
jgi:hypothetical protein